MIGKREMITKTGLTTSVLRYDPVSEPVDKL